ncbi:MAG: molybdate transport system ATP-binding protein [Bermanella sp.]|jgi:molybdate transport system ATP-binding protein
MKLLLDFKLVKDKFSLIIEHEIVWNSASVHVLFGPSGCGKSHLLRSIAGLETISGVVQFNEACWSDPTKNINLPTHKRNVAMVFQDSQLFTHLNVNQNLMFALDRSNANQQDFDLCVQQLNIKHLLNHRINDLSGGEKQRVSIARSLLSKPQLLLMDEPLASLDWKSKAEILPFIQIISQSWNLPILYVTHSIDEVMQLADNVILLDKYNDISQVDKSGTLMEILADINNPFNQHPDASSLLIGKIKQEGYQQDGLSKVMLNEQCVYLTQPITRKSDRVRLSVHAKDVSISLSHAMDSSILNILNGKIVNIQHEETAHCLIQLEVDGQLLLSRISSYSAKRLNLRIDQNIFAQIKGVALAR